MAETAASVCVGRQPLILAAVTGERRQWLGGETGHLTQFIISLLIILGDS